MSIFMTLNGTMSSETTKPTVKRNILEKGDQFMCECAGSYGRVTLSAHEDARQVVEYSVCHQSFESPEFLDDDDVRSLYCAYTLEL